MTGVPTGAPGGTLRAVPLVGLGTWLANAQPSGLRASGIDVGGHGPRN